VAGTIPGECLVINARKSSKAIVIKQATLQRPPGYQVALLLTTISVSLYLFPLVK